MFLLMGLDLIVQKMLTDEMIEHLYSTPVYSTPIKDYQVLNYHIDKVIEKVDFNQKEEWGTTNYISTDFMGHPQIIKDLGLHKVSQEIEKHLREYCNVLRYNIVKYRLESWFAKFEKGNYSQIHNHGKADISGVYYYKTNGDDGDFFFESPNPFLGTTKCFWGAGRRWEYKPREGLILLFPGWLKHGVKTNTTDNTRISLSFNIFF